MLFHFKVNVRSHCEIQSRSSRWLGGRTISAVVVGCLTWLSITNAWAQDDPFGDAPTTPPPATTRAATAANATEAPTETNVVVLAIRDSNLQTPQQYGQALVWLARIQRFDEIGRYIDQIRGANWDQTAKAQLLDNSDTAFWLNIANRSEMTPEQRTFGREVIDAGYHQARTPEQLDKWISSLSSEVAGERAQARKELLRVDFEGLQRLAKAVARKEVANNDGLAASIFEFGERGIAMLEELVVGTDVAVSEGATTILAKIGPFDSASALVVALNRHDATEQMKKDATIGLNRLLGYVPNEQETLQYLRTKVTRLTQEAQSFSGHIYDHRWSIHWDQEKELLSGKQVMLEKAFWSQADREARGMLLLPEVPAETLESLVAIRLHHAFLDNAVFRDEVAINKLLAELPSGLLTPEFIGKVLRISRDRGWIGSEIRALQLLGNLKIKEGLPVWILQDVADATGSGNPGVRYAAFETIAALDPQAPYAGSHRVLLTAIELLRVGPFPQALIVSGLSYETGDASEKLRRYGMQAVTAGSGRAALRMLDGPNPYELIVIAGTVSDMPISTLVQRITESRYGSGVPVLVVLSESEPARRAVSGIRQVIIVDTIPSDTLAMQELWGKIAPVAIPKLAADDRISAAVTAGEFLKRLSADPTLYSFYNLGSMEEEIGGDFSLPAGWIAGDQLLGSFGSADGQAKLSNRIVDISSDLESRKRSAVQLVNSIRRHGVRMDRETVQLQYDRFNRWIVSRPEDAEPIGWILDAMEARAGMREWPELPQLVAAPAAGR